MSRLPHLTPAALDPAQRQLYDAITRGSRSTGPQLFALTDPEGRLNGPFNAFLQAPVLGDAVQRLGSAIRYGTSLTDRVRELAILAVAAHWESAFERYAHEPLARAAGVSTGELAGLQIPDLTDTAELAAIRLVLELVRDGDATDATYGEAVESLGQPAVFELTTLVGYYAMLALQLRVFRVEAPC